MKILSRIERTKFSLENVFAGQQADEKIIVLVRNYPLAYVPKLIISLVLMTFPLIVILILNSLALLPPNGVGMQTLVAAAGLFLLFIVANIVVSFITYYYSLNIVTNIRLVAIEQRSLFNQDFDEINLEDIEDVSSQLTGFFPSMYNFGSVQVQSAGASNLFQLKPIRHPRQVAYIISDLANQIKAGVPSQDRATRGEVKGMIGSRDIISQSEIDDLNDESGLELKKIHQNKANSPVQSDIYETNKPGSGLPD